MLLKDKKILITGSTRGIGLSIAKECLKEGAKVIIHGTSPEKVTELSAELNALYPESTYGLAADISNHESCKALILDSISALGSLDVLVNNAGMTRDNLLLRMKTSEWEDVIKTNLNSAFYLTQAATRPFLKQKNGHIINMASVVGLMGNAGQANYAASKAGLIGLTKSLAKELGGKNIRCNAIAPGFIETDMIDSLPKDYISNIIESIPLKRLGNTKDIARLVVFLASEEATYITGQVFSVDGGMNM